MEDDLNGRRPKLEEYQNERGPQWKRTSMEEDLNGSRPQEKTSSNEDDLDER